MIEIDGATKSGSGTILRLAVALSTLLGQELHLWNIRARRDKPGLRPQHLQVVTACAQMCGGTVDGAKVASREIFYRPGKHIKGGSYQWEIGTAGSTTMLAMTLLLVGCFADKPSTFRISGGLFQDFAPPAYHMQYVLLPTLGKMGISAEVELKQPGYVPRGAGAIEVRIEPVATMLRPLLLSEQGKVRKIEGIALSSHLQEQKVSHRMADECRKRLGAEGYGAHIELEYDTRAEQKGAALSIWAGTSTGCIIGADRAGRPGRRSEDIGRYVARSLLEDLKTGATVDRHLADQLIPYCALAQGMSQYVIPQTTDHVETNLWLVGEILGAKTELERNRVKIDGIGYRPALR
ncbi:MAG: RNA 3'-phosphate cyclase [Chloroflexi bacterium]|nr:RNA 3'-phosphate cyclase [Chloroflexota bacterium]